MPDRVRSGRDSFRLRARGVPYLQRSGRGDQIILARVVTPTKLTTQQKDLFRQLAQTMCDDDCRESDKGLLDKIKEALGLDGG